MKATETSLNGFLSQTKTQFVIPVYQRNYDWTEAQCAQLLDDILEVGARPNDTHFIGSIVFIYDGVYSTSDVKELVVIDGQQRLTTLSLLYLALFKFAQRNGKEEVAHEINETYLTNKFVKDEKTKLKLKQSDQNAKAFNFLLLDNAPAEYREFSRVIENYSFFERRITDQNFEPILRGLNNLLFVEISLERGKDDPQRIFESLNSTGLELSQADLIRNYILMGLPPDEQVRIFNTYWQVIEQNARDEEREESLVSDFIRDYLTFKTKKIPNKSKVYEEFKSRYRERDGLFYSDTLKEIKVFSFHYHKLVNPSTEPSITIERELQYIKRLEVNITFPFLLPVYQDYQKGVITSDDFVAVLRLCQSFIWRRFVVNMPTSSLNKIFMTLYSDVDQTAYIHSIEVALIKKKGSLRFPNNKDVEIALAEKDVYNIQPKNRVYLLELLENFNNREYVPVDNPNITIEHIFPQNPHEKWYNDLDEKWLTIMSEKYLNTLANLTLSGNNGSLGNRSFSEKKVMNRDGKEQGYAFSRLWLNQYLREIQVWGPSQLESRFKILLNRFFEVWPYPEVDVDEEIDTEQDYTLFNAPDPRFRKLDYFIFRDEKIQADEVSKMYCHVVKTLFEENPSAFYHEELRELLGLSSNASDLRSPYSLSPNYHLETNIDNNGKFRRLRMLLPKFNCEDDLLINFSALEGDDDADDSTDRSTWEERIGPKAMAILDKCERLIKEIDPTLSLNYMARHIGISKGHKSQNFIVFWPKRSFIRTAIKLENPSPWIHYFESQNQKFISVGNQGRLRVRVTETEAADESGKLKEVFAEAYRDWFH